MRVSRSPRRPRSCGWRPFPGRVMRSRSDLSGHVLGPGLTSLVMLLASGMTSQVVLVESESCRLLPPAVRT